MAGQLLFNRYVLSPTKVGPDNLLNKSVADPKFLKLGDPAGTWGIFARGLNKCLSSLSSVSDDGGQGSTQGMPLESSHVNFDKIEKWNTYDLS